MPTVCAFVRSDNICLAPPASWPKQFQKLKQADGQSEGPPAQTRHVAQ